MLLVRCLALCLVSLAWLKVGGVLVDVVAGGDEDEM